MLAEIRLRINDPKVTFNPLDYTAKAIKDRQVKVQAQKWLDYTEERCEANDISWETLKDYKGYVKNYINPKLGKLDVREIQFEHLEEFKDSLPKRLKTKTKRNILNGLHALFKRMHRKGIIKEFPSWPTVEGNNSDERQAINYEAQSAALELIPESDRDPIEFGFETGLRPGETCALQIKDFDEVNKRVLIRRTWSGKHLKDTTKGKNMKWIPLSGRAWDIFIKNRHDKLPEAFLFINPRTGRGYRQKVLNKVWKQCSGYEDLDHYSASRHSFCTQIVHDGIGQFEAQALMRHADLRSTQKYFHADTDKLSKWVERRGRGQVIQFDKAGRKQGE